VTGLTLKRIETFCHPAGLTHVGPKPIRSFEKCRRHLLSWTATVISADGGIVGMMSVPTGFQSSAHEHTSGGSHAVRRQ